MIYTSSASGTENMLMILKHDNSDGYKVTYFSNG